MVMAGLAIGSFLADRRLHLWKRAHLLGLEYAMLLLALAIPAVLLALSRLDSPLLSIISENIIFPLLAIGPAVLVGMQFPLAGKVDFVDPAATASRLYLADLAGACLAHCWSAPC